jgi:DNA-directed RNA polymerase specialized sigma24 family protein
MVDHGLIPDMGEGYELFRQRFLVALAVLARRGFVVGFDDGLDLIHDFFLDAWDGLASRYDPKQGEVGGYVYGAFIRYARSKIVELHRTRERLVDAATLGRLVAWHDDREDTSEVRPVIAPEKDLVGMLPECERQVLLRIFAPSPRSERRLAAEFGVTRHKVRMRILSGIARLATLLGREGAIEGDDRAVARALWGEALSVREAAQRLEITERSVRRSRLNVLKAVAVVISDRVSHIPSSNDPRDSTMSRTPSELLREVLASPGNTQLLCELKDRAPEILRELGRDDVDFEETEPGTREEGEPLEDQDVEWYAQVLEALGASGEALGPGEDAEALRELIAADAWDEVWVADMFANVLMVGLSGELRDIGGFFQRHGLEPSPPSPDAPRPAPPSVVDDGGPYTEVLGTYGMTPMTVFSAIEAVTSVYERGTRHGQIERGPYAVLPLARRDEAPEVADEDGRWVLPERAVQNEIRLLSGCREAAPAALYHWTALASLERRYLFRGFRAISHPLGVRLDPDTAAKTLDQRWGWLDENGTRVSTPRIHAQSRTLTGRSTRPIT